MLVEFLWLVGDNQYTTLMQKGGFRQYAKHALLAAVLFCCIGAGTVAAESSSSNSYKVMDTQFGSSSTVQTCSTSYCAKASLGDVVAGSSSASGYTARFGELSGSDPLLEVIVGGGSGNLGDLDTTTTATMTMTVQVRNYLSGGYVLQVIGAPPKYGSHTLSALSSPTASDPGTEQFGINIVANTSPSVGTNPAQVPSSETSFGVANSGYDTANLFKFSSGDVVAHSNSSSGRTDYTVSMIVNISSVTPAGRYSADFNAVVVPVY